MQCKNIGRWPKAVAATMLLYATAGAALADTYRITTREAGNGGFFSLDGVFGVPGPEATGAYEWRLTTEFTDPVFEYSPQRAEVFAYDVAMSLELTVAGTHYTTVQNNAQIHLEYFPSFLGGPLNDMRYSVLFTPVANANHARLLQSFMIDPALLGFADVLSPVSLATPEIESARFEADSYYQDLDILVFTGFASGAATTSSYEVSMVPEPTPYAMTLLGCAVMAGVAGRRRAARAGPAGAPHAPVA